MYSILSCVNIGILTFTLGVVDWLLFMNVAFQGPVVQSIVSLTTLLKRHYVKYMPTTLSNPLLFFC